jgi:hypothetical protein
MIKKEKNRIKRKHKFILHEIKKNFSKKNLLIRWNIAERKKSDDNLRESGTNREYKRNKSLGHAEQSFSKMRNNL